VYGQAPDAPYARDRIAGRIDQVFRRFVLVGFCACALMWASRGSAVAATEFCPAKIDRIYAKASEPAATAYSYYLQALASRVVEGIVVADTDSGWFTWVQQPVKLSRTTYVSTSPSLTYWFHAAESPELTVIFPQAVTIRHAWVATARTHGDEFFNWDARGAVTCEPPDFARSKYRNSTRNERKPQAGDETPAPAPPPATAVASAAPFPPAVCPEPFVAATVTHPVQPDFPSIVESEGFGGTAISEIAVALDPTGKLIDSWIWAKSGYPALDEAALKAARRSKYTGATSYCRPVDETYLFRADFMSH